jgi:hypothetical protein
MSSDATPQATPKQRPSRAQRLAVAGFLAAFGLTMLTVLLTGLAVKARRSHGPEGSPPAAGAAAEHARDGEDAPGPR